MRRITEELMSESMGFTSAVLTPDTTVTGLSGGERQGLAIVRALHFEADIIILDEPTMGLSLKETEKLLHFVDGIRAAGKSAIFIDHNIFHVYSVADRIVILDRGRVAGEFPTSRYTLNELMDIMREVAAVGTFTRAGSLPTPQGAHAADDGSRRRREPAARSLPRVPHAAARLAAFATRWASQIGITVAFLLLWLIFIIVAPATFLLGPHLPLVRADDAVLRASWPWPSRWSSSRATSTSRSRRSWPSGMVGFVWTWDATGQRGPGASSRRSRSGCWRGSSTASSSRSSASRPWW